MSDHEPTHLILHKGHFYEAIMAKQRTYRVWLDSDFAFLCLVGEEQRSLPIAEVRRLFEGEARREPASLQKAHGTPFAREPEARACHLEAACEALQAAVRRAGVPADQIRERQAMIRRIDGITDRSGAKPEGWGKRVKVIVLGDREGGSGIDQLNQIADDLMAGKT
jgi:hypothetical protein